MVSVNGMIDHDRPLADQLRGLPRILVTGSRDWVNGDILSRALQAALDDVAPAGGQVVLVQGEARGADRMARDIWLEWGQPSQGYPADWNQHGTRAGYIRNAYMVDLGPVLCLAFIRNGSRGATMCADLAEKADIPVRRYEVTE